MHQRLEDVPDKDDREYYLKQMPLSRLQEIIKASLKNAGVKVITDGIRQKFLQSLGTLQRKEAQVVRYKFEAENFYTISTKDRSLESVSSSDLKNSKTLFYTEKTSATIPDEYREFYDEAVDTGNGYKCILVTNSYSFKTPLNAVIADHENERRFLKELVSRENVPCINAWMKSTPVGFYEIDYAWKKGTVQKRGKFNPDFFVKINNIILVVEIKGDEETGDPSEENKKKNKYALDHFERVNEYMRKNKIPLSYKFNFLTPSDYGRYFQSVRDGSIINFRSTLDVELAEE